MKLPFHEDGGGRGELEEQYHFLLPIPSGILLGEAGAQVEVGMHGLNMNLFILSTPTPRKYPSFPKWSWESVLLLLLSLSFFGDRERVGSPSQSFPPRRSPDLLDWMNVRKPSERTQRNIKPPLPTK
jgi:hypothetical protein